MNIPQEAINKLIAFGVYKGLTKFKIERAKTGSTYLFLYDQKIMRNGSGFWHDHDQIKNVDLVDLGLLMIFRFADHLPSKIVRYINYIIIDNGQVLIYKGRNLLPL